MPLVSAPSRGYSDWQRVQNYDSGVFWSAVGQAISGPVSFPIEDVSRYEYLGGRLQSIDNLGAVTITWYADAAGTIILGERSFTLSGHVTDWMQIRIVNLGPFVGISFAEAGAGTWHLSAQVFATNRYAPTEVIPIYATALLVTTTVNGGTQVPVFPLDYVSGPVLIELENGGSNASVYLQGFTLSGVVYDIDFLGPFSSAPVSVHSYVPLGYWQLLLDNASGINVDMTVCVTPSLTGST